MRFLIIDTVSENYKIYLFFNNVLIQKIVNNKDYIIKELKNILHESKASIEDLNFIGVLNGPGTYTSIRVGVALVNGLGLTVNVPIVSATLFDVLINSFEKNNNINNLDNNCTIIVTISNYKEGVFAQIFNSKLKCISEPLELTEDNIQSSTKKFSNIIVLTNNIKLTKKLFYFNQVTRQNFIDITAENIKNTILRKFYNKEYNIKFVPIEGLYIKPPKITIKIKE